MQRVRLAIIGTRGIGNRHAVAAQRCGAEIAACAARTRESVEKFRTTYGVKFGTTRPSELAKREDVDAAVICSPNRYHFPQTLAMLNAGKDVLLEKPMAMNAKESAELVKAAKRLGRVLMVGHMWRFDDEAQHVRDVVQSGAIGRPVRTHSYGLHVNWGPSGWFLDERLAGGGAMADMGIHALDTARFILGDPLPEKVYATIGTHYGDYNVDDTGVVMIEWEGGVTSVVEAGWRQPHADRPNAGTQVYGTKGYAALFPTEIKMKLEGKAGSFTPEFPPRTRESQQLKYDRQMEHFVECVRTRKVPVPGAFEGHVNMAIVDAAYESSRTGRSVSVKIN